jgi:glycosyltransferase involved in cell wall biosynthesis
VPAPETNSVAIVIPAHQERDRISSVLQGIPTVIPGIARITLLVVDDGSTDGTDQAARQAGATVIRHPVNLGAGAALRTGTAAAVRLGADIVVHMDADGQHPPEDLPRLVAPLLAGADAATGVRTFGRPMPWLFIMGNRFLSWLTRVLFAIENPDTQCAYRAFWVRCWPTLEWDSRDYAFATEMLVRGQRGSVRWATVPIRTVYLDRYKGTGLGDGVRIARKMLRWRILG